MFLNPVDGSDEMTRKIGQKGPSTVFFSARPFQLRHVSVNDGAINNKKKKLKKIKGAPFFACCHRLLD